jgi:hypothetical protein
MAIIAKRIGNRAVTQISTSKEHANEVSDSLMELADRLTRPRQTRLSALSPFLNIAIHDIRAESRWAGILGDESVGWDVAIPRKKIVSASGWSFCFRGSLLDCQ